MTTPTTIDWVTLLDEIAWLLGEPEPETSLRQRASTVSVAVYLHFPRSTVLRWMDGSEPRHSDGEVVLAAWVRLTGKAAEFAPRARRSLSAAQMR